MNARRVVLILLFGFLFLNIAFLTAAMLGDNWWSTTLTERNDRFGLLRQCMTLPLQSSPELFCSFRENALKFNKNSVYEKDLDVAAVLNIVSLGFCLIAIIVLILTLQYPFIVWIPVLVFIFLTVSGMLTLALVVFVQIKIHKNIATLVGPNFSSKGWSFYISYCALIAGLVSLILGLIFMVISLIQHSKKGKRLNDHSRSVIPNAPDFPEIAIDMSRENKSYTFDDLPVYSELDNVDSFKYTPDTEPHVKMRAFYSGTYDQTDTEYNFS
ncbi:uncharacterized protein LOC105846384 isoform X1 [Hydra vulgaris]|uniref:uncharacterized protein LOC105846384 isoform X1 n=1 Tax=Hydra vulgaris TaxID=6087 RepID=UPI001F5F64CD|nr:uncharacterized protein LOC105846384 [Hydra vulgaris]